MANISEDYLNKIMTGVILVALIVLTFFLIKPILLSMVFGVLLAFVFYPVYSRLYRLIKLKDLSVILICILLVVLIVLPLWLLTPIVLDQAFKIYLASQDIDFAEPIRNFLPSFSDEFASEITSSLSSFVSTTTNSLMNSLSELILNFPTILLQLLVVFFTFYFVLRDKDELIEYIRSLLPFSKEVERKLFRYSKDITFSVLYGQVVIGILQGLVIGLGFFIFGIQNALLLTLLAMIAGIFPIIGTAIIWLPLVLYFFIAGSTVPAFGLLGFGLVSSSIDNLLRPIIVARKARIHSSIVLIGMIGGYFFFGVLGFILGPLILSYLLVILEVYRKKTPSVFIQKGK